MVHFFEDLLLCVLFASAQSGAIEMDSVGLTADELYSKGLVPKYYCGINSAYAAAVAEFGKRNQTLQVPFGALVSRRFVSSNTGSSNLEIERAVEFLGLSAKTFQNLSWRSLENADSPMILNVCGRGEIGAFSHWFVFLGCVDRNAMVADGGKVFLMPASELLCRWNGTAVAVYSTQNPPPFYSLEIVSSLSCIGLIGLLIIASGRLVAKIESRGNSWFRYPIFFVMLMSSCVFALMAYPNCYSSRDISRSIAISTGSSRIPEINFEEFDLAVRNRRGVLLDCRYFGDFKIGSIGDAISMPVDVRSDKLREMVQVWPHDAKIILFCQSKGCKFSDIIGAELSKHGFSNLRVYRGGFLEWERSSSHHASK